MSIVLLMSSCSVMTALDVQPSNSVWTESQRNYWVTLYFMRMSEDESARRNFTPFFLHALASCIIKQQENLYPNLTWWERNIGLNRQLHPEHGEVVHRVARDCADITLKNQLLHFKLNQQPNQIETL